jgi:DNA-binding NarL/FixJ family response regulator
VGREQDLVRVLIVDDIEEIRRLLRILLRDSPHLEVVGEAEDGIEAIALVAECRPDVVVMDVEMPRLGGIEATQRITALWPNVRVLGCTSVEDAYVRRAMYAAGAAGLIDKSQAFSLLVPMVEAAARSESVPVVVLTHEDDAEHADASPRAVPPPL